MDKLISRNGFLELHYFSRDDLEILYMWRNSESFRTRCTCKKRKISFDRFRRELSLDFKYDRHEQMIVRSHYGTTPVGFIYSYSFDSVDGHAFVSLLIEDKFRVGTVGLGVRVFALFVKSLFDRFNLYKVYFDVYSDNDESLKILKRLDEFKEEGIFLGHRINYGKRINVHRFALYHKDVHILRKFL